MSSDSTSHDTSDPEFSAPWSLIRSAVLVSEVASIRRKFHIPKDYEIIVPGPNDRIDKPPDRCLSFHIAALESGLRFPLSKEVKNILSGLGVCPAQLAPNSFVLILVFIILMRHFKVEPSFARFSSLNQMCSSHANRELGFFYLSHRLNLRLLHSIPKSLNSNWKDVFIYVRSPENSSWGIPKCWNLMNPRSHTRITDPGLWEKDFIMGQLMVNTYDMSKILTEEVLALAGLSPAAIKTTRSLDMAVRASVVGKAMTEQKDTLLAQSQPSVQQKKRTDAIPPVKPSMVDKAMTEQKDTLLAQSQPSVQQKKRTDAIPPVKPSSKGIYSNCSKQAQTEKYSGEVARGTEWTDSAEKLVRDMRSSSRDGDINFTRKILRSIGGDGDNAVEMNRRSLRRADQVALADVPLVKLEDVAAHLTMANYAVTHQLVLRAAKFNNELRVCKKKANEKSETELGRRLKELEKSLNDSNLKNADLQKRLGESESRLEKMELVHKRKREESFNAGRAAGIQEFVESHGYCNAMKETPEKALDAFVNSSTYSSAVARRAAVYEYRGFSKCKSLAEKLGAFKEGFNPDSLRNEDFKDPSVFIKDEADAYADE